MTKLARRFAIVLVALTGLSACISANVNRGISDLRSDYLSATATYRAGGEFTPADRAALADVALRAVAQAERAVEPESRAETYALALMAGRIGRLPVNADPETRAAYQPINWAFAGAEVCDQLPSDAALPRDCTLITVMKGLTQGDAVLDKIVALDITPARQVSEDQACELAAFARRFRREAVDEWVAPEAAGGTVGDMLDGQFTRYYADSLYAQWCEYHHRVSPRTIERALNFSPDAASCKADVGLNYQAARTSAAPKLNVAPPRAPNLSPIANNPGDEDHIHRVCAPYVGIGARFPGVIADHQSSHKRAG